MLGINHIHLYASTKGAQREGRKQVGLAGARMSEHAYVRVGVVPLVEGIDEHRRASREIASDNEATLLLEVGFQPGKERDQGPRIQDAFTSESLDAKPLSREVAVEHTEEAGLELTQDGPSRRLDPDGTGFKLVKPRGRECQVDRHMEG